MPPAPPASTCLPVPPERLLEYMLAVELKEAKTADGKKTYHSGTAARIYGKCREATVAARVVEIFMKELEKELNNNRTEQHSAMWMFGVPQDLWQRFFPKGMQKARAQVAASVKAEHRRLDKPASHDLHAAGLMLLAQLEADSSAAGDGRPVGRPSETRDAPTLSTAQTSGVPSQEQAASQVPTASSAAGVGTGPEGVSGRPASGQRDESKAVFGAVLDRPSTGTQQSPEQVSESRATSVESTGDPSTEASAQRASSQPVACDESLHQLPPPPEGAAQAASQHSSDSQDASQSAASCAERSGSSSIASGAAAVPQGSTLTSDGQAPGSHSSPGRALSPPCLCRRLLSSLPVALIRPLAHKTVTKQHLRRKGCC